MLDSCYEWTGQPVRPTRLVHSTCRVSVVSVRIYAVILRATSRKDNLYLGIGSLHPHFAFAVALPRTPPKMRPLDRSAQRAPHTASSRPTRIAHPPKKRHLDRSAQRAVERPPHFAFAVVLSTPRIKSVQSVWIGVPPSLATSN